MFDDSLEIASVSFFIANFNLSRYQFDNFAFTLMYLAILSFCIDMFSASLLAVFKVFCVDFLEAFVVLSAILLPIKSPVAPAVFSIPLFDAVLSASVVYLLLEFNTAFLLWLYYLMTKVKFTLSSFLPDCYFGL